MQWKFNHTEVRFGSQIEYSGNGVSGFSRELRAISVERRFKETSKLTTCWRCTISCPFVDGRCILTNISWIRLPMCLLGFDFLRSSSYSSSSLIGCKDRPSMSIIRQSSVNLGTGLVTDIAELEFCLLEKQRFRRASHWVLQEITFENSH